MVFLALIHIYEIREDGREDGSGRGGSESAVRPAGDAVSGEAPVSYTHLMKPERQSPLMSYSRETLSSTVLQATEDIRTSAM